MIIRRLVAVAFSVVAMAVLGPTAVQAQEGGDGDCGEECEWCSILMKEGQVGSEEGDNDMSCDEVGLSCDDCAATQTLLGTDFASGEEISAQISASASAELDGLVEAFGDRILVAAHRSVVAIKGTSCSPDAVDLVLFLSDDKAAALRDLGAAVLDDHLDN